MAACWEFSSTFTLRVLDEDYGWRRLQWSNNPEGQYEGTINSTRLPFHIRIYHLKCNSVFSGWILREIYYGLPDCTITTSVFPFNKYYHVDPMNPRLLEVEKNQFRN